VRRIYTRPDEKYRERGIVGRATESGPRSQGA
jgi:hypothetical protein